MEAPAASVKASPQSPFIATAHLFILCGLAVAQPLFDLLARRPEFFIAHDARPIDLVLVALALSFGLPLILVIPMRATARWSRWLGHWAHLGLVAGMTGLIALQLAKRLVPFWPMALGLALVGATTATAAYSRWRSCGTFLTLLAPAGLLFPLLFLLSPPIRALLLPATSEATRQRPADSPPVVMVILDELPLSSLLDASHRVDSDRYPNFAALAEHAYWFRDATTAAVDTTVSVPILLSGRLPESLDPLPETSEYPHNLFTWLAAAGYRLNAVETQTRLCPRELCAPRVSPTSSRQHLDYLATDLGVVYLHLLLPEALANRWLPPIDETWSHFTTQPWGTRLARGLSGTAIDRTLEDTESGGRRTEARLFAEFLSTIDSDSGPVLHFIHLLLPHPPWRYLPSGKRYGRPGACRSQHEPQPKPGYESDWQAIQGFQRHLLQVGYVDRLIGRLVARLKQQNLYDRSLLILVADHGATFHAGVKKRQLTNAHAADVLNVPLFIKLPGQEQGEISDRNVETIDLLPTVADALGMPLPRPIQGLSALDTGRLERPVKTTRKGKTWSIAALRLIRERSVARKLALFGSGAKPDGLFRIGRRADLVGHRISDLSVAPTGTEPAVTVTLDRPETFEKVDPDSWRVPAQITGRVHFAQPKSVAVELAIAINGTLEAVTQTFDHAGDHSHFTAMVPERALLRGCNRIELFEISDQQRPSVLLPIPSSGGS